MLEECQLVYDDVMENMEKSIHHLQREFQSIRAGKASPSMLDGVMVDFYGVSTPINQTSNVTSPDPRQIIVQPWDKSQISNIEKAIMAANLGFNPKNEGEVLRIIVPAVTEERRKDLVKQAKSEAEDAKIAIRNSRRSGNDEAKQLEKEGVAEDDVKKLQDDIQKLTDDFVSKVDKLFDAKEKDIMTI
ncbi:MAG: ribosome recycling factor [Bacteroidales bacterium]|nr:ribosome recycling factor [Bacteroidales bacterium]MCF8404438.1 ribosome recycling factor [Bacteroidales bacterium]